MPRPIIYPYRLGSRSGRVLSEGLRPLRGKRVRENGNYRHFRNHLIINWGNPRIPIWDNGNIPWLNSPDCVAVAGNKLQTYQVLSQSDTRIPRFTTDIVTAQQWITEENIKVLGRRLLRGHSGHGIILVDPEQEEVPIEFTRCPLYVQYVKKQDEYRVHVFKGDIIDVQQKKVRNGSEGNNWQIRNFQNGWVFCRADLAVPQDVLTQARNAVAALNLDFGAVDIGYNRHYEQATVYEVNTAPGLVETSIDIYVNTITNYLNKWRF